jgi:LPPG:FO 2-phospho-L-lactate transferase
MHGLYICPDVDIAIYTLAGMADSTKGWGLAGDTFKALAQLSRLGEETWFRLGDRDMAASMLRTKMMRAGGTLTEATSWMRRSLGVKCPILPVSDDPIETRVITHSSDLHLQEFWVREKGKPKVVRVDYNGSRKAAITDEVRTALSAADRILLCPANPVTSIGPMLAIPSLAKSLSESGARKVALSPMSGSGPFSGPAGKLMKSLGRRPDSVGVARFYSKFLDCILIRNEDSAMRKEIEGLGVKCLTTETSMSTRKDERRLAQELILA